ncbi:MAG: CsoR family transcriptional regulator, copper-sensing transcriptional repressor [Acetobacterium sp.]|jgi:DNA-binding FrmR family transcriptional regulator|uniref:metal-sensing transcriptional repressor n=1 Tax=unclassified Acetobacterium TaxID=2638182 RepID=UPI000DBEAEE3|nr:MULTISPECIES: metal-sensing transcriptional repressor [unclassified Acetobacterium]AWW26326.1 BCR family protein [Acetobacterium sp. KB-1]MDK2940903.1 CsoR family transcriptional regulator, copper-sensing transcriptional repressor [Acetobacterium sp.]MDZ5726268.1 metal-sensing transcriptional repressor [Acetobacterium sp. K1/6]
MEVKDRTTELNLLKTARGQIDGIIKMLENDRYCIDISKQILAVQALLKKTNLEILKKHMNSCVADAFEKGDGEAKIDEIMLVLDKYYR